jgi:uncharacterized protein
MLIAGFASGVHCAGMCGGFVGAYAAARTVRLGKSHRRTPPEWVSQLALSAGRITSYAIAGAVAGGAGTQIAGALEVQTLLFVLANGALVLAGFYIAGAGRGLVRLEALGAPFWRVLQPRAARLLGAPTLSSTFAAGFLWGWLPCGLVYGALAAAAFAGSATGGAAAMLAFGLGTLPNLLAVGVAAARLRNWAAHRAARVAAGALLLGFGTYGLARAGGLAESIRHGLLCL